MFIGRRAAIRVTITSLGALTLLAAPPASAFEFLSSFGSKGTQPAQFSQPGDLFVLPDGTAYVADSVARQVKVFAADGSHVRSIGKPPPPPPDNRCEKDPDRCSVDFEGVAGVLRSPQDVVVNKSGEVFVANSGSHRIEVFSSTGTFLRAFGKGVNPVGGDVCTEATGCRKGVSDSSAGTVRSPIGLGIDSGGLIYVAGGNPRVDVFKPDGAFVRSIGKPISDATLAACGEQGCQQLAEAGVTHTPSDVAVAADGRVAVADYRNFRIDVFDKSGTFLRAFGKGVSPAGGDVCTEATGCRKGTDSALAGGLGTASGIAVAPGGNLYVSDSKNHRVAEFSFDGAFVRAFGEGVLNGASAFQVCTPGTGCRAGIASMRPGSISTPRGVATDCAGAVYVAESATGDAVQVARVERFGDAGTLTPPCISTEEPLPPLAPSPQLSPAPVLGPAVTREKAPAIMKPKIKIELNPGSGSAVLLVLVADPGTLTLRGRGIRRTRERAKGPGLVELFLEPTGGTLERLQARGKATVKASLTFKPAQGAPITQAKAVSLKMASGF